MATGDVTGAKRPRYQANERFDSGDADAASRSAREGDDETQRALLTTPRATGGTLMPGMLVTGLSITLNPTGPADGKIRIGAELGVAIDADGRVIVKPVGLLVDVNIPAGNQQVYLYYQETPADTATRRFLTVTTPFTEYAAAMATTFQSTFAPHVRPGTAASMVQDDVVTGVTTPLVAIAAVLNTLGACTMAGRPNNAAIATIPNGLDIINRLSNVEATATLPGRYASGTPRTLHDLLTTHAYMRGRAEFLGGRTTLTAYNTTSSAVGVLSWTDAGASWVVNELAGCVLRDDVLGGLFWLIASNTATTLTLSGRFAAGFGIIGAGTPTGGVGIIYGPIAGNNFGAYTQPSRSLQQQVDLWNNFFNGSGDLVMPPITIILLPNTTGLELAGDAYVHQRGTLYVGRQISGVHIFGAYLPTPGTRRIVVKMCGGGAGGGGVPASAGAAFFGAAGGGGSSGVYFEKEFYFGGGDITGGPVALGGGGAGGVGAVQGSPGTDTTITIQAAVYTAKGGGGGLRGRFAGDGAFATSTAFIQFGAGGIPQAGSSPGDFIRADHGGTGCAPGTVLTSPALGGSGGGGMFGIGGAGADFNSNGSNGSGNGAGGGGASSYPAGAQPAFNGGAGTQGHIIIDEYR